MRKGIIYVYFNRAKYEKEGIEKYYVGQTIGTMEQRSGKNGKGYGALDENCDYKFARAIRKWGWDAFEGRVLEEVYEDDLDELEMFYIEQFDSYKNGYNETLGGKGFRGINPYNKKTKKEKEEICKKISKTVTEYYKNPDNRKKTSEANKKYFEDPDNRKKTSEAVKNFWKNITQEKYEEFCKINSENNSGEKNCNAKNVYCNELNIIFSYVKLAEKYCINVLNSKIGPINRVCNGKRKSTGKLQDGTKLTWNWLEDVDEETLKNATYIDSEKYEELIYKNVNDCK